MKKYQRVKSPQQHTAKKKFKRSEDKLKEEQKKFKRNKEEKEEGNEKIRQGMLLKKIR